jgi:2-oxoglutarate dehydrogenase E2 component (dihydrolipoamide succinyltransferase)
LADVILPSLGESITEGIVTKWFKAVGESVDRDEPLFEISTDKVDSEVPSPASGVLTEILAEEGDTVAVGATIAVIGDAAGAPSAPVEPIAAAESVTTPPSGAESAPPPMAAPASGVTGKSTGTTASPMVRRLLEDAGVDAASLQASGAGGRITRRDAERAANARASAPGLAPGPSRSGGVVSGALQGFVAIEADYEGVERARRTDAARAARVEGIALDDAVFAVRAAVEALAEFPVLNASISDGGVEVHGDRNIGVAIDLEERLLVPVIAGAQDLNLRGLARRLSELLVRARAGELAVKDLLGGTFSVVAAPSPQVLVSIPQIIEPQVAVLSVGGVARRAVVLTDVDGSDSIAIRSTGVLGLGFDTRVVDATTATMFLERVATLLATQDWSAEL